MRGEKVRKVRPNSQLKAHSVAFRVTEAEYIEANSRTPENFHSWDHKTDSPKRLGLLASSEKEK
jgi:hypothetical protein